MRKIVIALAALLVGGLVYVLWRDDTLTMFIWFDQIGLTNLVESLRNHTGFLSPYVPHWILFSLPNALWLISGLLIFESIWGNTSWANKLFWFSALWFIAIGAEVCQGLRIIPGTFDWHDMALMILAGFFAHVALHMQGDKKGEKKYDSSQIHSKCYLVTCFYWPSHFSGRKRR